MAPKTYDGQTARLIAQMAENFPRVSGDEMQNCIQHMPRLMKAFRRVIEKDAVVQYGIWYSLPRDEMRSKGLLAADDRSFIFEFCLRTLIESTCWEDYWYDKSVDDKMIEGLKTRWLKLPFAAERLIKIPVSALENSEAWQWTKIRGAQPCSHEAAARIMIRREVTTVPNERLCFFSLLKAPQWDKDLGSHFCITCDARNERQLIVEHNVDLRAFTHVVLAEREFHI